MERIELGATGLQVSRLGLGTVELGMPYGLAEDPPPTDDMCIRLLHCACEGGINYIDTAAAYGRSEELVGRAFGQWSDRPIIATKVALRGVGGAELPAGGLADHIRASVERSLRLLQTDRLDILKIHSAEGPFLTDELVAAMAALVDSGDIGLWGASTYELAAPADALREPGIRVLQVAYNLLDQRLEDELLPRARAQGVGIVLRSVFLKGVLSDRRRELTPALAPLALAAEEAAQIAAGAGIPLSEMALRFAIYGGAGDVTLIGTAHQAELEQNLSAWAAGPLSEDVITALDGIVISEPALLNPGNWPLQPVHINPEQPDSQKNSR